MSYSAPNSERVTAIVSTLAAIAILAGGVTAFQSHHAPVDDLVQMESDLRFQLENAFRHDPNERTVRFEQLQHVTAAWEASPRTNVDREKLSSWLLEATIRSMPGSFKPLPTTPDFGAKAPETVSVERTPDILLPETLNNTNASKTSFNPAEHQQPTLADTDINTKQLAPTADSKTGADATYSDTANTDVKHPTTAEAPAVKHQSLLKTSLLETSLLKTQPISVQINLSELIARIAGYHLGLNEIEQELHSLDLEDFAALAEQVRLLEEIAEDYDFADLYYQALSDRERQAITAPRPLAVTAAQIERQLNRAESAHTGDFLEAVDANNQTLITELRQRLANIAH